MAEVDYARGRALQSKGQFDKAREAYQAVIRQRGGDELAARAQLMRGETYFHQKLLREALKEFLKVDYSYKAPKQQAAALLEAGKVFEGLDQWAEAAEIYEKLGVRFPNDPSAAEAAKRLEPARQRAGRKAEP
jgi:TolA-binding protein